MTDNERDLLEQLDASDRAERLARKEYFTLGNEHLDIIVNALFHDTDADNIKLGRILRDLVAFNVDGTTDLLDNADQNDKADITARRLLYDDSLVFQNNWLVKSIRNTNNRLGKTKAPADADEQDHNEHGDEGLPTLGDVTEYARVWALPGVDSDTVQKIARKWYDSMTKNHWHDEKGEPIQEWRKVFQSYASATWLKMASDNR